MWVLGLRYRHHDYINGTIHEVNAIVKRHPLHHDVQAAPVLIRAISVIFSAHYALTFQTLMLLRSFCVAGSYTDRHPSLTTSELVYNRRPAANGYPFYCATCYRSPPKLLRDLKYSIRGLQLTGGMVTAA